jgi:hypothetical protein
VALDAQFAERAMPRARTTTRTETQTETQTRTPSVVYKQVASDDAGARIAEALRLLARAGVYDA